MHDLSPLSFLGGTREWNIVLILYHERKYVVMLNHKRKYIMWEMYYDGKQRHGFKTNGMLLFSGDTVWLIYFSVNKLTPLQISIRTVLLLFRSIMASPGVLWLRSQRMQNRKAAKENTMKEKNICNNLLIAAKN